MKDSHFVIGTSGHIDHGKTTLVKALTGTDPDRLAEEKKRGITIDLGFASYQDEQGSHFSFIDVPGHEKFVHNMLAGAAGIDAVLLVIAADEGVMPQTREHLDICQLLNLPSGIIVLTRCDLVEDPEIIELCKEEVQELVEGTFLETAPIIPVSSITGDGLDLLKKELNSLYKKLDPHEYEKPFRFSIDRSFTIKGFGTVVTGTVTVGTLNKNTEIHQFSQETAIRIRGIQVHGQEVEEMIAGQRAAINISNLSKEEIQRGDQLAKPGSLITSYMLNVELRILDNAPRSLRHRVRIRIYLGTKEVMGRLVPLDAKVLDPGSTQLVQIRLEQPVSSRFGDRFIIRNFSPIFTLGGGTILDPAPGKSRRVRLELSQRIGLLRGNDPEVITEQVIYLQSTRGVYLQELSARTGYSEKQLNKITGDLASRKIILSVDPIEKRFLHTDHISRIGDFISRVIQAYHKKFPEREGMTKAELSGKLLLLFKNEKEVDQLLKYLVKSQTLQEDGHYFHLPGHEKNFSESQEVFLQRCLAIIDAGGYQPPRQKVLLEECGFNEKDGIALLKIATHNHELIRVADDLYYVPKLIDTIEDQIRGHFDKQNELTVIEFKDILNITRKHAIELLEYFDKQHLTKRVDNHRILQS